MAGITKNQRSRRIHIVGYGLLVMTLLLLVACSTTTTAGGGTPTPNGPPTLTVLGTPDAVEITRINLDPAHAFAPWQKKITDTAQVQRLFSAVKALPPIGPAVVQCAKILVSYNIKFLSKDGSVLVNATLGPCAHVALTKTDIRQADQNFLSLFAQTVGVAPGSLFFPTPTP